jgi:tetratricopeptide (TPR) repeat protein
MEVMAKEQHIPYNSEVYLDGINQYKNNLKKILSKYSNHDIPVILSTVVSNEKDIIPFISDTIPNIDEFNEALEKEKPEAKKIANKNAHAAYSLGSFYLQKNKDTAKKYLHLAKELDLLRFRAPEKINELIIELSKEYNTSLVDMKSIFEMHSKNGIVGNELMTEHVHPNIEGQFLMADAFYNKIKDLKLLSNWHNYIPYEEAIQDIPVSLIDSIQGIILIDKLKISWPYNINHSILVNDSINDKNIKGKYTETKFAQDINRNIMKWDDAMAIAYKMYEADKDFEKGLDIAQTLIFEYPEQATVYKMAGDMCMKKGDYKKAAFYFYRYNYFEESSKSAEELAKAYIKLDKLNQAEKTLAEAKKNGLNVSSLAELLEKTREINDDE